MCYGSFHSSMTRESLPLNYLKTSVYCHMRCFHHRYICKSVTEYAKFLKPQNSWIPFFYLRLTFSHRWKWDENEWLLLPFNFKWISRYAACGNKNCVAGNVATTLSKEWHIFDHPKSIYCLQMSWHIHVGRRNIVTNLLKSITLLSGSLSYCPWQTWKLKS